MGIYGYTKNYKLIKPEYNTDTWHDYEYNNLDTLDAVLGAIYNSGNWAGEWRNNTKYEEGSVIIDKESSNMYRVLVEHVTDDDSTFAEFWQENPDWYILWSPNNEARDWAIKTEGKIVGEDYSAKAYAIGGEGLEEENAKYFMEQTKSMYQQVIAAQGESQESSTNAATKADEAKQSADDARESADLATSSAQSVEDLVLGFDEHVEDKKQEIDSYVASTADEIRDLSSDARDYANMAAISNKEAAQYADDAKAYGSAFAIVTWS